jgi:predicted site-specific integrase-resolvase
MKGIWSLRDTAQLFPTRLPGKHVSVRTIQDWIKDGKLVARDLPGRGRFLSEDLEAFLRDSRRRGDDDK